MRKLKRILPKKSGRSNGVVTVRHQGGRNKRFLREIDFKRNKREILAVVETVEVDPNRNSRIALIRYADGERRYMLAPIGLIVGQKVIISESAPLEPGNSMPMGKIAVGTYVHN